MPTETKNHMRVAPAPSGREKIKAMMQTVKEFGILAVSLPFLHVSYITRGNPRRTEFEHVVDDASKIPSDGELFRTRRDGQLHYQDPVIRRDDRDNWTFCVHSDGDINAWYGHWPTRYVELPHSASLTKEQAAAIAKQTFT